MSGKEADNTKPQSGFFSRLIWIALIAAATFFVVRSLAPQTIGEQARRYLQRTFQDHYQDFAVEIGSGRYDPAVGMIFEDIVFRDKTAASQNSSWSLSLSQGREVARVDKLIVVAKTQPRQLLEKQNPLVTQRIVLDGLTIDTWLDESGKLAIQKIFPLPQMGPAAPRIDVQRGRVRYTNTQTGSAPIEMEIQQFTLTNPPKPQADPSLVESNDGQTTPVAQPMQTFKLLAKGAVAQRIDIVGAVYESGLRIHGNVVKANVNSKLLDALPKSIQGKLKDARGIECVGDLAFVLDQPTGQAPNYHAKLTIHNGRFHHERLSLPINNLRGVIECKPSGLQIQAAQGEWAESLIRASGSIAGYKWPDNASFDVSVGGLRLEERLRRVLPKNLLPAWQKFQPQGQVDIDHGHIAFRDGKWTTEGTVNCLGLDVRYDKFPYPVEQLVGKVTFKDGLARCERMDGRIGGQLIRIAFSAPQRPEDRRPRTFVAAVDGKLAIDEDLVKALTKRGDSTSKLETFVRSLRPRGSVQLVGARLHTDELGQKSQSFELRVVDGHLRYEKFPYPLFNVGGTIRVQDELVTLHDFHGSNANGGSITCEGSYRIQPTGTARASDAMTKQYQQAKTPQLRLTFQAKDILLDDALRSSLPKETQNTWQSLSPSGAVDELTVMVQQQKSGVPIELALTGVESESKQLTNRALSIQPHCVPYRLDITDGQFHYANGQVTIDFVRAQHGATRIAASGNCFRSESGRWRMALDIHSGSRVAPDEELIRSLPDSVQTAMYRLQLRRPVSVRGSTGFLFTDLQHQEPEMDWNVVLQLEGNRIGDVSPVHSLRGEILAKGLRDERGIRCDGEVRVDSMHLNEIQITGIQGPFSIRGNQLTLGAPRSAVRSGQPLNKNPLKQVVFQETSSSPRIKGKLFGGDIELSGDLELSSGSFDVDISLTNGRVPTLLAELGQGRSELSGLISGQTNLEGILGTTELLNGVGSARVAGANVYQLPLLVQLLNLLRIKPTEDVAFTDADVNFAIVENEVTFNDLKMWGDLVALRGGGTLDRRGELDLTFDTQVSPKHEFTRVFRPFRSQRYTLMTIDVDGPLSSPRVIRRPLDGVEKTLGRLLPISGSRTESDHPQLMKPR